MNAETRVKFTPRHAVRGLKYDPQLHNSLEKHNDIDIVYGLRSSWWTSRKIHMSGAATDLWHGIHRSETWKLDYSNRKICHLKVSTSDEHAYIVDGAKSIVVIENCIVVIENCIVVIENCMTGKKLTLRPYVYELELLPCSLAKARSLRQQLELLHCSV